MFPFFAVHIFALAFCYASSTQALKCHEGFNMTIDEIPFYHWTKRTCSGKSKCFGQDIEANLGMHVAMRYGSCLSASYVSYLNCTTLYGPESTFDPGNLLNLIPDITSRINDTVQDFVMGTAKEIHSLLSNGQGTSEFVDGVFTFFTHLGFNMHGAESLKGPIARLLSSAIIGSNVSLPWTELTKALDDLETKNETLSNATYKFISSLTPMSIESIKSVEWARVWIDKLPGLIRSGLPPSWNPSLWYDVTFQLIEHLNVSDWKQTALNFVETINSTYEIPTNIRKYLDRLYDVVQDAKATEHNADWTMTRLPSIISQKDGITDSFVNATIRFARKVTLFRYQNFYYELLQWVPGFFYTLFPGRKEEIKEVYQKLADDLDAFNIYNLNQTAEANKLSTFILNVTERELSLTSNVLHLLIRASVLNFSQSLYDILDGHADFLDTFVDSLELAYKNWPNNNIGTIVRDLVIAMNGTVPLEIEPLLANLQPVITAAYSDKSNFTDDFLDALRNIANSYQTVYPDSLLPPLAMYYIDLTWNFSRSQRSRELGFYLWELSMTPLKLYFVLSKSFVAKRDDLTRAAIEAFPSYGTYIKLMQLLNFEDFSQFLRDVGKWVVSGPPYTAETFVSSIQSTVNKMTSSVTEILDELRKIFQPKSCKFGSCDSDFCNGHRFIDSQPEITEPVDPCASNPCLNGGICKADHRTTLICECTSDFTGERCEDKQQCTIGRQGDDRSCTGQCKKVVFAKENIPSNCGVPALSFNTTIAGLFQRSNEVCRDGRSVATLECSAGKNATDSFNLLSLNCVACTKTLSTVIEKEISPNATVKDVESTLKDLQVLTTGKKTIQQTADIVKHLKGLTDVLTSEIVGAEKKMINPESMRNVMQIVESLGDELQLRVQSEPDVTEDQIEQRERESEDSSEIRLSTRVATQLLDTFARKIDLNGKNELEITTRNTALKIQLPRKLQNGSFEEIIFGPESYVEVPFDSETVFVKEKIVKLKLPDKALRNMDEILDGENFTLVTILHRDASLLTADKRTGPVTQATFKSGGTTEMNPIGTSFSIEYVEPPQPSPQQIKILDDTLLKIEKNYFCVFWNFSNAEWSTEGCVYRDHPVPTCECNHFTSFALLLRVTTRLEDYSPISVAEIYSLAASGLSAAALIATILIYLFTKELRIRRPTPILLNICFNLAMGYIVFIVGMDGRAKQFSNIACYVCAVTMHVVFLCSWFWMLIYTLNMYFALVKVIGDNIFVSKKSFMYIFGYAVPVIIVAVDLSVSTVLDNRPRDIEATNFESHYIASHICWLRNLSMYFGFALPIGMILIVNLVLFFIIIRKLTWKRNEIQSTKQRMDVKQRVVMAISMITMMGLTWIFGYLMLISDNATFRDVMSVLFDLFNTCQGIVIFWVSCIRQKTVRKKWFLSIMLCCRCKKARKSRSLFTNDGGSTADTSISATNHKSDTAI